MNKPAVFAIDQPALRVSNELRKRGEMCSIWLRHDLEPFSKRLKALSAKVAQDGLIITEDQLHAFERAKEEIKSSWRNRDRAPRLSWLPRHFYYVGNIKGVGRIYQQTVINSYCKEGP